MGTAFETEMGVIPELSQAVQEMDWLLPTDIQAEAVPQILGGRDVLMAAETGSGKTGAFALPILQIVYETLRDLDKPKAAKKNAGHGDKEWRMNMYDRGDAMAIDNETNRCQSRDMQNWHGCRATKGVRGKGKYYFEATVTDEGLCRVGWATEEARLDLGTDKFSFGYGGTGKKSFGKQFDSYGEPFGLNDVIGNYLDLEKGEIKWSKNGKDLGLAFTISPNLRQSNSAFFPAICLKNAELELNFGMQRFRCPPTGGFTAVSRAAANEVVPSRYTNTASTVDTSNKPNAPLAIIIEPSRELAEQTLNQIRSLKKYLPNPVPRELLIIGGQPVKEQLNSLMKGVDIVVATPGRLEDLINEGMLLLSNCRFFVLDECDGLLSAGYEKLIINLHSKIPKVTNDGIKMQMIVCSATLHSFDVTKMAERLMRYPVWIDLKGQDSVPETVHHVVCMVDPMQDTSWKQLFHNKQHVVTDGMHASDRISPSYETPEMLSEAVKILKGEYVIRAIQQQKMDRALIFCRTKVDCDNLEQYFIQKGGGPRGSKQFSCVCLHGDRSPNERKANLEAFKSEKVRFLICTDVAARGIDIRGLPYVINVTLPDEKQNYIHRIGRVGRAERMGLAVSLVSAVKEKVWYHSNCNSKGRNCFNTQLTDVGGCAIWYNEPQLLGDIEEHLGVTIDQVDKTLVVQANEFDGKVVYGQKMKSTGSGYQGHVDILLPAARELAHLEKIIQDSFLDLKYSTKFAI